MARANDFGSTVRLKASKRSLAEPKIQFVILSAMLI